MRCPACQVDLNENAALCPLCGGLAEDTPPLIPGISYQDYPAYKRQRPRRKLLSPWSFLPEAVFVLSLLLLWGGYRHGIPFAAMLASGAAFLTLGAGLVLALVVLLQPRRERHLVILLLLTLLGAAGFGASCIEGGAEYMALSASALVLSLMNLSMLRGLCGKGLGEELKARFLF